MQEDNLNNYQGVKPPGTERMNIKGSILQVYSVGQAAANLAVGQTELEVYPSEKKTYTDGEVTDNVSDYTTQGVDASGNSYSTTVQASNSIRAKWLSRNPWLKTPGLVRRGEDVIIWRVGDTDQYYWELMGTTNHLRRRDIVLFVVSNTTDESTTELTPANSYFFEINTVDKHITLSTPNNDGEACGYTVQLNTKDGNFSLSDTIGNAIVLDSVAHLIQLMNADNSTVKVDKTKILIAANDEVMIKTKSFIAETETTKMTGQQFSSNYPTTTMEGNNFSGQFPQTNWGGAALSFSYTTGTMDTGGGFTVSGGGVNFDVGSIRHNGKAIDSTHKHNGIQPGGGNTGPVV